MAQYFDKLTNEKLPNGDISSPMTMMNKELASIKAKGIEEGLSIKDKAHFLAVAKELVEAIDYYSKKWSAEVANQKESFDFEDLGKTVSPKMGGAMSKIADGVFNDLTLEEIKACATVSEKSLKEIGKEELIKKYKTITGNRANSVSYKSLV